MDMARKMEKKSNIYQWIDDSIATGHNHWLVYICQWSTSSQFIFRLIHHQGQVVVYFFFKTGDQLMCNLGKIWGKKHPAFEKCALFGGKTQPKATYRSNEFGSLFIDKILSKFNLLDEFLQCNVEWASIELQILFETLG